MFHTTIYEHALSGRLFNADLSQCAITNGRRRVLDVGCGSSIWCIEMAQMYPDMIVDGFDLYINRRLDQPLNDPKTPNCTFFAPIDFTGTYWAPLQENNYDLVRAARLCGSVADWRHLASCIFRHVISSYIQFHSGLLTIPGT